MLHGSPLRAPLLAVAALVLVSVDVHAQQPPEPPAPPASPAPPAPSVDDTRELRRQIQELRARLDQLEAAPDRQETALKKQVQQLTEQVEALSARLRQQEEEPLTVEEVPDIKERLSIYGFFDVQLMKFFMDEDSFFHGMLNDNLTFMINHLNLYVKSQLTMTLSALIELRFTFLPMGNVISPEIAALNVPHEREDTTVKDPYTGEDYQLGGVDIERVHLTYHPKDYFGVLVGRYLTPFGIWNVDHGSPVIIPVRQPFTLLRATVPLAQTGIQVFGRLYPAATTAFDYALTLSNGRGPMDAVVDLDDNKGIGLRLRLSYEIDDLRLALGVYGYWGTYTDKHQNIASFSPFEMEWKDDEVYTEWVGSADLLLMYKGIHFQSELVGGRIEYDVRPQIPNQVGYHPDFNKSLLYALLAYELPLRPWLGEMRTRPYVMFEWEDEDEVIGSEGYTLIGGLNFQPSPWVTLKAEGFWTKTTSDILWNSTLAGCNAQIAVSF